MNIDCLSSPKLNIFPWREIDDGNAKFIRFQIRNRINANRKLRIIRRANIIIKIFYFCCMFSNFTVELAS